MIMIIASIWNMLAMLKTPRWDDVTFLQSNTLAQLTAVLLNHNGFRIKLWPPEMKFKIKIKIKIHV